MKSPSKQKYLLASWMMSETGTISVILILSIIIFLVNLSMNYLRNGLGFPLDDAWIHQTYARNLASKGTWEYSINGLSAGSTSPLWTILLMPGFFFGKGNPFVWTFFLSWLSYFALAVVLIKIFTLILPKSRTERLIFGILIVLEWHFVWAAGSGMESIVFTLGIALILYLLLSKASYMLIGFMTGLLVWIRPDGITFLGPVLLILVVNLIRKKKTYKTIPGLLLGMALPLIAYGYHNQMISGQVLPNTFFAKSAEYSELLENPLSYRYFELFKVLLSGAGILLFPGFAWNVILSAKQRDLSRLALALWILGFIFVFAVRLPVSYQHGRYLIPVLPFYLLLGFIGTMDILSRLKSQKQPTYKTIIFSSLVVTSIIFLISGINAYSTDVKIINELMVTPSKWLRDNTESDAIIAAHDIGAIGYFSQRKIVDLAGLIDPEVVPIIRNERELEQYILNAGADYLIVFSDWYQEIGNLGAQIAEFTYHSTDVTEKVIINRLH